MSNKQGVAIFDLDGTLTRRDTFLHYLGGYLAQNPMRALRCWKLPVEVLQFRIGRITNTQLKEAFFTAVLQGVTREVVEAWTGRFVERLGTSGFYSTGLRVLRSHREAGDVVVLMTASPDCYVYQLGRWLGVHDVICTHAEWNNGRLSGRFASANVHGAEKLRQLVRLRTLYPGSFVTAYADDASDLPMLRAADRGVVVNGSARARTLANKNGLEIVSWGAN